MNKALGNFKRMTVLTVAAVLAANVLGCGDSTAQPQPPKGTAALRFTVSNEVRKNSALVDPLVGTVYGDIFLSEDVALTGPRAGSQVFASVKLDVDLTAADPSTGVWTSEPLDPNLYVFLGAFDLDGNLQPSGDPDPGDPVTLPVTNKFEVKDDQQTDLTVIFELVYN